MNDDPVKIIAPLILDPCGVGQEKLARRYFAALEAQGYRIVGPEPTEEMWATLARDIMTWAMFMEHDGKTLHAHIRALHGSAPDWLHSEIPDSPAKATKGAVVVAVWRAMLAAAPTYGGQHEAE